MISLKILGKKMVAMKNSMQKVVTSLFMAVQVLMAVCAVPEVENVLVKQNVGSSVYVTYDLSEKAIVTMDILTNGVSIGVENFTELKGAVNRIVDPEVDTLKIKWDPRKTWSGLPINNVTFKLTAWSTNSPPDYLVYDFVNHTTNFYVSAEALPDGGLANNVYKTDRIVLRKIPAKNVEWVMGPSASEETSRNSDAKIYSASEVSRSVTLTEDFYIGVFEVTQAQYRHGGGTTTSRYVGDDASIHPVEGMQAYIVQGKRSLADGRKKANGFLDLIRQKTGIDFDVPSEAQWEFACRAGTRTSMNSGHDIVKSSNDANMDKIAWTIHNSGLVTHPVGMKPANEWGLYDMHGNVAEYCADWFGPLTTDAVIDPAGCDQNTAGSKRVLRGGGCQHSESCKCRSAFRTGSLEASGDYGFRIIAPVTLKW